jgi:uncharacterized protein YbaR (Trm112 family)
MKFDTNLLFVIVCPSSHLPLRLASQAELDTINSRIATKSLETVEGVPVQDYVEEALVRSDGEIVYPVREGFPRLMIAEGITVDLADSGKNPIYEMASSSS